MYRNNIKLKSHQVCWSWYDKIYTGENSIYLKFCSPPQAVAVLWNNFVDETISDDRSLLENPEIKWQIITIWRATSFQNCTIANILAIITCHAFISIVQKFFILIILFTSSLSARIITLYK